MTTPPPLRQRPLMPGRGRVYLDDGHWKADYRHTDGTLYGVHAGDAFAAASWVRFHADKIRTKAILRNLPDAFWDVAVWSADGCDLISATASVDIADRRRIVERIMAWQEAQK